jgi:hypothetical protein
MAASGESLAIRAGFAGQNWGVAPAEGESSEVRRFAGGAEGRSSRFASLHRTAPCQPAVLRAVASGAGATGVLFGPLCLCHRLTPCGRGSTGVGTHERVTQAQAGT